MTLSSAVIRKYTIETYRWSAVLQPHHLFEDVGYTAVILASMAVTLLSRFLRPWSGL
jgi:hypothetical protein